MNLVKRTHSRSMPSIFDELFTPDWFGGFNISEATKNLPAVNIKETDTSFSLELAAPGLNKEDFQIELEDDLLTIASEREHSHEEKEEKFTRKEFSFHAFKRSFTLPETVDRGAIKANYENGVLLIELPKLKEAQKEAKRLIDIS